MYATPVEAYGRYEPVTLKNIHKHPAYRRLPESLRHELEVAAQVLPFRTNPYVLDELIDWERVPEDPIFQLVFPQRGMLDPETYARVEAALASGQQEALNEAVWQARHAMNPHPAGQLTHNVPELDGQKLAGLQHKYAETVLFFPAGARPATLTAPTASAGRSSWGTASSSSSRAGWTSSCATCAPTPR